MKLKFNDGSIRELPFNAKLAARLIYLSQQHDDIDYRLELADAKREKVDEIQREVDALRIAGRCKSYTA